MKKIVSSPVVGGLFLVAGSVLVLPQPAYSVDCDTLYVEIYPPDSLFSGFVRVPISASHQRACGEGPHQYIDSLAGFVIPLSYTHTNPGKYCSVSGYWNNTFVYPSPEYWLERSIFRHFLGPDGDTLIHNWVMSQSQPMIGLEWDLRLLDLDGTSQFRLAMVPTGSHDQLFWDVNKTLLATMTFRVEDTMTICIDSCFWPPSDRLCFISDEFVTFVPYIDLPYCLSLSYPLLGDANADGVVSAGDVVFLLEYLYRDGRAPHPLEVGDVNCDGLVNAGDVVFLITYLFRAGPPPSC